MNFCVSQELFCTFCGWLKLVVATLTRVSQRFFNFFSLTCLELVAPPGALAPASIAPQLIEAHRLTYTSLFVKKGLVKQKRFEAINLIMVKR